MKTMNIKSTDYRVQITESGSVPGSVLAAIRKASVLGTLCSVLLISSCTHDEIIPPTPLAPQGTKTVTVDFQLPEGKPGFGEVETRATTTDGTWANGDELLMRLAVRNINEEISDGTADIRSASVYLTLVHDGAAWDVNEEKSYSVTAMGGAITAKPYAQLPLLAASQDLALTSLTLMLDENFGEVGECVVQVYYAPDVERVAGADGKLPLQLKATATTTAPEMWQAAAVGGTGSLDLKWVYNDQARLRVHTGVAGDVVTLTSSAFSPNLPKSADGIYTATTDSKGNAYFYGKAGTIDESYNPIAINSGFNLSLTAVTVGEGDAAFTWPIAPVTLLEASTLVPVQLEAGKSYCLDATEKRPDTGSMAVINGTLEADALQTDIRAALAAGQSTIYVTGEPGTALKDAINAQANGSIDLVLPAATSIGNLAFLFCSKLASVSAPAATSIGASAFTNCTALTSVSAPKATTIGDYAFRTCTALTSVELPEATTIGESAFDRCTALTSVELPEATTIGAGAFSGCAALTSVELPVATSIGENAFANCAALTSLTFGEVITSVGTNAFDDANNSTLTLNSGQLSSTDLAPSGNTWAGKTWASIRYVDDEGNAVTVIDGAATNFDALDQISTALDDGQSTIYVAGTTLGSAVIEAIKAQAYRSIDLVLPAATTIEAGAFQACNALKSVSAPKATEIKPFAFGRCEALTSLSFGTVKIVSGIAFENASTETCDLTLGTGTTDGSLDVENKKWADKTWKSITLVDSN